MRRKLLYMCLMTIMMVCSMSVYALDKVGNVYQIGTAADWEEFAALVNGGEFTASAELTADIDLGMEGTMIGVADQQGKRYDGTFDGKGHTIKINFYPEAQDAGPFRYLGWRGIIQNLKVEGAITTSSKFAAGIVGRGRGIIRNCWADVKINSSVPGDATHGGIVGVGYSGTIVENCLVQTAIVGTATQNCGGVVGWAENPVNIVNCLVLNDESDFDISNGASRNIARNDSRVKVVDVETYNQDIYANRPGGACYNNYVTNQWETTTHNPSVTVVPLADLADGKICYQLNNDQSRIGWVQRIGTDPYPVPAPFGSGRVYASAPTDCNGLADDGFTFSNSGSDQAEKHEFDMYGICSKCGMFNFHHWEFDDPTRFDQISRSVLLNSKADIDVAEGMNRVCNGFKLNMKMVNDIEYIAEPGHFIFNTNDWTEGDFDGGGHALTIELTEMGNNAALFPIRHNGSVENLIMHGKIETSGQYAGSISNDSYESAVRNVYSDIDIISSKTGDNTSGGFFGMIRTGKHIENCIYAGTISVPLQSSCARIGGFAGWTHAQTYLTNCAVLGHFVGAGDQSAESETENSSSIARNWGNIISENVYVAHPITGRDVKDQDKYILYDNEDGIANGELAFLLNGKQSGLERFYQKLGTDEMPLPVAREGGLIYAAASSYTCDGTPEGATYQNTPAGDPDIPPHEYVEGFCKNCGHLQENFMTPVDGWFEIGTPAQLLWWSNYASTHLDASAKLTADIDLEDYNEIDENTGRPITPRFAQVGSEYKPFYGNFDGQRHTISNLNINLLGKRGCGLISVMNSQPEAGFGGVDGDEARAAEGVYVKDVVLDETCSITGGGYTGIVGMGSPWAGHITITGCMNLGNVYVVAGTNGAGIYGCSMGSACRITINACGMIGDIHVEDDTRTENGSFSGWLGTYAEVTNCFALGTVEYIDPSRGFARHPAGAYDNGTVILKNCYALDGVDIKQVDNNSTEDVTYVTMEALATGEVTWGANGKQFRDPVWYQTLGEDDYPYPFDTHGVVIYVAEQYMAVSESTLPLVTSTIASYYSEKLESVEVAYTGAIEDMQAKIDAVNEVTSAIALADALDSIYAAEAVVNASAEVYKRYQDKCEEVKTYLEENPDLTGPVRVELEAYLENDYEEIMDEHNLPDSLIEKEIIRVEEWKALAIKSDYKVGNDVTSLFVNTDFHNDFKDGWTSSMNKWGNGRSTVTIDEKPYYGSEAWNTKFDMHQTVKDLKPGYYLVGVQGAFRPCNDRYSYNYAAQVYANDNVNYLQSVIEDYVTVEDAINGENVYIEQIGGGNTTYDLAIYDDGFSTSGEDGIVGYVVQGPSGVAVAGYAGRYQNYIIAKAEGDSLTIGITNPGTNYGNDWTGFSSFKVVYAGEGEDAEQYVDVALESMIARANVILTNYRTDEFVEYDMVDQAQYPNYPAALKEALEAAVAVAEGASGTEAKMQAVEKLSQLFKEFYEARQAYLALYNAAKVLETVEGGNLNLVEKDEEFNEWVETGDFVYSDDELDALSDIYNEMYDAYAAGTYSIEQAQNAAVLNNPTIAKIVPSKDSDGYYLVSNPKQFVAYRAIASDFDATVKAKLTADIDMKGIAMQPIGHNKSGENAVHIYRGVLDGQGHALTNVFISEEYTQGDPATLFYELKGSTVKNFKLTGEYFNTYNAKFMGGLTRWMSESSTIDNCEIEVVMHSFIEGDGTHGGVVGVSGDGTVIKNCLVNVTMIGEGESPTYNCGGVVGWANSSPTISNTLILSKYQNITKGDNSNTIGRNGYTANNVFYVDQSMIGNTDGGTKATDEQLASGEITYKLNGSQSDKPVWFQTLGTDVLPRLFDGGVVYYYAGEYTNEKPNIQLNSFASNLSAATNASQVAVAYTLNADAASGAINFYAGDELKYSYVLKGGELKAGAHDVALENSQLGVAAGTKMTYALEISSIGVKAVSQIGESYKVWGPYGMVINNNPASKGFGQTLMVESYPQEIKDIYISHDKPGALYAFDVNFQPINSTDGTPGFYGGLSIKGETPLAIAGTYQFDLRDLRFTADGRLFVARASGLDASSVYEINPEDLDEPWKPVFKGGTLDEATGITYVGGQEQNRMAIGLAFEGKGADLKMYVLGGQRSNGGNNVSDYNCSVYNLGTATEWTGAPSANYEPLNGVYTYSSVDVGIHEDGQGGLWFIQNRNTAENPALKHFDATGKEDYSSLVSTNSGKIAMTADGNYIAIPQGSGKIVLYENTYTLGGNGKIILNPIKTINVSETRITALAFDYANNLYVASASTETVSRYAIPSWTDNKVVTPAAEGFVVGTESGDPDGINNVNVNDNVNNGAIYNLAGQRVSKAQKGIFIQEGRKVANK